MLRPVLKRCPKCKTKDWTKTKKVCTCTTVIIWLSLILFFIFCLCCICCYSPSGNGPLSDYIECKCLRRTVVHTCKKCNHKIGVKHTNHMTSMIEDDCDEEN